MKVSIIIAHDPNRGLNLLEKAIQSVKREIGDNEDFELLIETEGSASEARNKAVANSSGEILVFLDDDVEIRSGFFREILQPFQDHSVGIVGGVNLNFDDIPAKERISAVFYASPLFMGKSASRYTPRGNIRETDESEIISCNMAVRKAAFQAAGGFPLDVIPCEENVLINRIQQLGWKIIYDPFAIVYHSRPSFPLGYMRKIFFYGTGRGIMLRKTGSDGAPRMFWKPSWMWLAFAVGFILHYASYISGLIYGYFRGEKKKC